MVSAACWTPCGIFAWEYFERRATTPPVSVNQISPVVAFSRSTVLCVERLFALT